MSQHATTDAQRSSSPQPLCSGYETRSSPDSGQDIPAMGPAAMRVGEVDYPEAFFSSLVLTKSIVFLP